jgi:hypothetical protein
LDEALFFFLVIVISRANVRFFAFLGLEWFEVDFVLVDINIVVVEFGVYTVIFARQMGIVVVHFSLPLFGFPVQFILRQAILVSREFFADVAHENAVALSWQFFTDMWDVMRSLIPGYIHTAVLAVFGLQLTINQKLIVAGFAV